ncbi:hypothetical protein UPYG_G00343360 [Umbra pygmaea]|uniref:Uncharacterized protein n=1 Tax=Umbra pygmaea TaxID=75934 RepID=A0ABD0WEJ5_UMBPY
MSSRGRRLCARIRAIGAYSETLNRARRTSGGRERAWMLERWDRAEWRDREMTSSVDLLGTLSTAMTTFRLEREKPAFFTSTRCCPSFPAETLPLCCGLNQLLEIATWTEEIIMDEFSSNKKMIRCCTSSQCTDCYPDLSGSSVF